MAQDAVRLNTQQVAISIDLSESFTCSGFWTKPIQNKKPKLFDEITDAF